MKAVLSGGHVPLLIIHYKGTERFWPCTDGTGFPFLATKKVQTFDRMSAP